MVIGGFCLLWCLMPTIQAGRQVEAAADATMQCDSSPADFRQQCPQYLRCMNVRAHLYVQEVESFSPCLQLILFLPGKMCLRTSTPEKVLNTFSNSLMLSGFLQPHLSVFSHLLFSSPAYFHPGTSVNHVVIL